MGLLATFDANGAPLSGVSAIDATAITSGQVSTARGGTGQDLSASTGVLLLTAGTASALATTGSSNAVRATSPSMTTPAIAGATLTGDIDANGATFRAPVTASALTATEGYWKWDSTDKIVKYYDGTRERGASGWGFQAFADVNGANLAGVYSSSTTLAANGGTAIVPFVITGHMLVRSVTCRNNDTATARSWRWDIYVDLNNTSNSVTRCATSNGSEAFTPGAATNRTLAASSAPVYLPPGTYYLAIQNSHASSTFALGVLATGGGFAINRHKTKTTTNPNGSTLDIIAATWTAVQSGVGAAILGDYANSGAAW